MSEEEKKKFGKLSRITGTMGAGKTKVLLGRLLRKKAGCRLLIKHSSDCGRFEGDLGHVVTHDGKLSEKPHFIVPSLDDPELVKFVDDHPAITDIFIDDLGFFKGVRDRVYKWLVRGRNVTFTCIHSLWNTRSLPEINSLEAFYPTTKYMWSDCDDCGSKDAARFHWRDPACGTEDFVVAGKDKYKSLCPACFDHERFLETPTIAEKSKPKPKTRSCWSCQTITILFLLFLLLPYLPRILFPLQFLGQIPLATILAEYSPFPLLEGWYSPSLGPTARGDPGA